MSFDRIARHYRWMELVLAGGALQRCRTAFLHETTRAESALFLGEGNGRCLVPFLETNRRSRVVCVEESGQMIAAAKSALRRRKVDPKRVRFVRANVLTWNPPPEAFDLIVSHFFLDCFTEDQLRRIIPAIASAARPGCIWLFADFRIPSRGVRRVRALAIHRLMYAFFRIVTKLPAKRLTPPDAFLREAGFRQIARITAQCGLIRSDCWTRDASVRSTTEARKRK